MEDVSFLAQLGEGELPEGVVLAALLARVAEGEGPVLLAGVQRVGPVARTLRLSPLHLLEFNI